MQKLKYFWQSKMTCNSIVIGRHFSFKRPGLYKRPKFEDHKYNEIFTTI